ncbi:hypothetical protein ACN6LL_002015, partial [Streptomyces violaceoruber]
VAGDSSLPDGQILQKGTHQGSGGRGGRSRSGGAHEDGLRPGAARFPKERFDGGANGRTRRGHPVGRRQTGGTGHGVDGP